MNNQRGSALALLLTVVAVIGVVSYVVMRLMGQVMDRLGDDEIQLEAQMLASDMKEYTKYLLAYERIIYVENPAKITATRKQDLRDLWAQANGGYDQSKSISMMNVCGGYTVLAEFIGNLKTSSGDPVFCAHYLRDPTNTGKQTEDMLLNRWANRDRNAKVLSDNAPTSSSMSDTFEIDDEQGNPLPQGQYRIRLKMSGNDSNWYEDGNNTIPFAVGQKIFEFVRDKVIAFEVMAEVRVDFFTDSFGMKSDFTERYVRVSSEVTVVSPNRTRQLYLDQESFVMRIPTMKDFAIFVPYPSRSDGTPTKLFSESMKLGPNTKVYGRVYFNGDIDTNLSQLPEFQEPVFISGQLTKPVKNTDVSLFRKKFRRGIVTNLSANRYVMHGKCPFGQGIDVVNGSGLECKNDAGKEYTINDFISRAGSVCRCKKLNIVANGVLKYGPSVCAADAQPSSSDCPDGLDFVKFGMHEVEVAGSAVYAFVASPIRKLTINKKGATIMGIVVGGHIDAGDGADFYGITAMHTGLPGIGNATTLSTMTAKVNNINDGISAPLANIPLIQNIKDGFK